MRIVIVGNGPAAISAVEAIRAHQMMLGLNDIEIWMLSKETTPAYAPMFLTDYIMGKLEEKKLYLRGSNFYNQFRIKTLFGDPVDGIDDRNKRVILQSGREFNFDRLLIATGAVPIKPPIKGIDREHVFFLNKLSDAKQIAKKIAACKKATIIGAGAIGIEAATALNALGLDVSVVELLDHVVPAVLDKEGAHYVERNLRQKGIKLVLGDRVSEIFCRSSSKGCVLESGKIIESDLIIVCVGVRPSMDIVKSTDIKTSKGIIVNEKMETSVPDIYAAGDAVESPNLYGNYTLNFTWYSAVEQGWTAGCNIVGIKRQLTTSVCVNILKGLDFVAAAITQAPKSLNKCEVLTSKDEEKGIFEKIVLDKGHIVQYQGVNVPPSKIGFIHQAVKFGKSVEKFKDQLFKVDFNSAHTLEMPFLSNKLLTCAQR